MWEGGVNYKELVKRLRRLEGRDVSVVLEGREIARQHVWKVRYLNPDERESRRVPEDTVILDSGEETVDGAPHGCTLPSAQVERVRGRVVAGEVHVEVHGIMIVDANGVPVAPSVTYAITPALGEVEGIGRFQVFEDEVEAAVDAVRARVHEEFEREWDS